MSPLSHISLGKSVFIFALVCLLSVSTIFGVFAYLRVDRTVDAALEYAVRFRANAAVENLARALEGDWRTLASLSERASHLDNNALGHLLTGAVGDGRRITWIGLANLSGEVVAATDDLLLGDDVSGSRWYRNGLKSSFATGGADAMSQQKDGGSGGPSRFINFSQPVRGANGAVSGVLGMHIDAAWLAEHLRETSNVLGIDLYLINSQGEVSASSSEDVSDAAELPILRAAQLGADVKGRETWPDGRDYFSYAVPQVMYGGLPNLGWHMVARLDVASINFTAALFHTGAQFALLIALAVIGFLTLCYVHIFARPFSLLADTAQRISYGSLEYPENFQVTSEAAQFSSALIHLQQNRITADRSRSWL